MIELTLNEQSLSRLEKIAAEKELTTQELVEEILRQFIQREKRQTLQRELTAFQAIHSNLMAEYSDAFVAIHQGRVVDHDADQLVLFKRIDHTYPDEPVLIKQVLPEPNSGYPLDVERVDMGVSPDNIVNSVYPHLEA